MIAESQLEQITQFKKEISTELANVNKAITALREKISGNHNEESAKSILKSSLSSYMKVVPEIDVEGLEKLLDKDLKICT